MRIALIGGTGLVGRLAVQRAAAAGHELHRIQRRASEGPGQARILPPSDWGTAVLALAPDAAVSTLGTTIGKAGSEDAFRQVDLDMVVDFARAAAKAGAKRMIAVSSVGADAASRNFYLRTKGQVEQALGALGFARLDLFRPGLLGGDRGGERRLAERLGIALSPLANLLLRGPLDRFAAIDAQVVADAIVASLDRVQPGIHIHHNREIFALASR